MFNSKFKKVSIVLIIVLVLGLVIMGCEAEEDVAVEEPEEEVEETEEEVPYGGWLDSITLVEEDSSASAVTQLGTGDLDVYADGITEVDVYEEILDDDDIQYAESFGSYTELSFNPAGPEFEDGDGLNPFAVPEIREAMNWLVDREYLADEIYGGMATPRLFPFTSSFPDYATMIETARELELEYSYDMDRAEEIISEEMEKLGAEMVDGVWYWEDEPVELGILIRSEDERTEIGDYVAGQLEEIGFETERRQATAEEASPIWMSGNPEAGEFHIYTGGWVTTVVERDQSLNWDYFYTPRGMGTPLWQAYEPSEEFDEVAERLARRDFSTLEEREELMDQAMRQGLEDNVRMWLVDQLAVNPYRSDMELTADMAGGISGSYLWGHTIRREDEVGGEATVGLPGILTEPWNPLDGTNWIFDQMVARAVGEYGYQWDPYTGLHNPNMFAEAEVHVEEGLPVDKTLDWVDLEFVEDGVEVPEDAWADWDAEEQEFITAEERFPEGENARRMYQVTFPDEFFEETEWHDGSNFSTADIIWAFIQANSFDRAQEESDFFDESTVSSYESAMEDFRGLKVVSEDPLTIEWYSDLFYLDAEWYVTSGLWPYFEYGQGAWHNMALGYLAEINEEVAHSSSKADELEVEWLNMVDGPSLEILEEQLEYAMEENFIPYENTLGEFISEEEAEERYQNLKDWYEEHDHFWLGTGPYYLDEVHSVEGIVELSRFEDYPYQADRWDIFEEPMDPEVDVDFPGTLQIGEEADIDISITFEGEPYATEDLGNVSLLVFDENEELVDTLEAEVVEEGEWTVELTSDLTEQLLTGTSRLETVVTSDLVATPVIETDLITTIE